MSLFKKIILIILVFKYSDPFAGNICNMNGDWFDPSGLTGGWYFQQNGTMLIGMMKRPSDCGAIVTGTVNEMGVSFTISTIRKSPECNFHIEVDAKLIPDCRSIEGSWRYITNAQGSVTGSFILIRNPVEIIEPIEAQLVITSQPQMPAFHAKAAITNLPSTKLNADIPVYTWGMKFTNIYVPNQKLTAESKEIETDEYIYHPVLSSLTVIDHGENPNLPRRIMGDIIGGDLTLSMEYFKNIHVEKQVTILGTNPGQAAIEKMIFSKALKQIACQESRYRQFDAKREGGVGYPMGTVCGVGIMQLCNPAPTPEQAWDWSKNVEGGTILYEEKYSIASNWPNKELEKINKLRVANGLRACDSLPNLGPEQIARDTIRLYNCGHEYQWEPWNDPDCKGRWVLDPTCKNSDKRYDPEYVDRVLACDINH